MRFVARGELVTEVGLSGNQESITELEIPSYGAMTAFKVKSFQVMPKVGSALEAALAGETRFVYGLCSENQDAQANILDTNKLFHVSGYIQTLGSGDSLDMNIVSEDVPDHYPVREIYFVEENLNIASESSQYLMVRIEFEVYQLTQSEFVGIV